MNERILSDLETEIVLALLEKKAGRAMTDFEIVQMCAGSGITDRYWCLECAKPYCTCMCMTDLAVDQQLKEDLQRLKLITKWVLT